jgi:hypothetical protein
MGKLIAIVLLVLGLFSTILFYQDKVKKQKTEISVLTNNVNAYELELLENTNKHGIYIMTMDELKNSKDSMIIALEEIRVELGIKDKQLESMTGFNSRLKTEN